MADQRLEIGSTYVLKKSDFDTLLSRLTEKGFETIDQMVGKALPNVKTWENLNLLFNFATIIDW